MKEDTMLTTVMKNFFVRLSQPAKRQVSAFLMLAGLVAAVPLVPAPVLAETGLLEQVPIGPLSVGGRATYYDSKDGGANWFGGGQVRFHPSNYFAIEGSADYRRSHFGDTRVHTYPVQVSALIYPLGTTRLAPFLLGGGGWYYTTVKGPGNFDDTQNRFGAHAGGGLQYFLNTHWSVDSTYRYIWLEKIQSKDSNIVDKKFQDNGHMVTIGVNYHF